MFSFTIAHRGPPAFQGAEPYAFASVTLDEGVNVIANMVKCTADELTVGMRVKPHWHPLPSGEHLLMWQPDKDAKERNAGSARSASRRQVPASAARWRLSASRRDPAALVR